MILVFSPKKVGKHVLPMKWNKQKLLIIIMTIDMLLLLLLLLLLTNSLTPSILATCPIHLNVVDLITLTPILIPLGPIYSPQDLVFKYSQLASSLNVRDHVSQPYSTTGNIIVLLILIFKFLERSLDASRSMISIS